MLINWVKSPLSKELITLMVTTTINNAIKTFFFRENLARMFKESDVLIMF